MLCQHLDIPGADVTFYPYPVLGHVPDDLFNFLKDNIAWEQRTLNFGFGPVPQPRLVAWYSKYSYTYSGMRLSPQPMTPLLEDLARTLTRLTDHDFNGVLLNYYKDGQSSIGMHADDEPEFGHNPFIASLSLGHPRRFDFQRTDKSLPKVSIELTNGSVLTMGGETQTHWKHGIAKTKQSVGPRINLTFRNIVNPR